MPIVTVSVKIYNLLFTSQIQENMNNFLVKAGAFIALFTFKDVCLYVLNYIIQLIQKTDTYLLHKRCKCCGAKIVINYG
jgi:hypothetical protein